MGNEIVNQGEVLLYSDENGKEFVNVVFMDETFWLTQKAMAELFGCTADNISLHLKNIFAESELVREAVTEKFSATAADGKNYLTQHYNLDAIIAEGYRVNSKKATRFRQWATKTLKEYIQKGFVLNDELMKNGRPFGKDYFDELLERIREIRASERRAYQKIADVFEQCSYNYDKQRDHESLLRVCAEQAALRRHRQNRRRADFRAGKLGQPHDGAYHVEGRAGWERPYLAGSGGEKGRRDLRGVPQKAGRGVHFRI